MFGFLEQFNYKEKPKTPCSSILIVEDNGADRIFFQRVLEKKNYSVLTAADGETALVIVQKEKVDIIILDYVLPGMNGIEICKILKENKKTRSIPVIFLTVVDTGEVILECYGAGAEAYIHKPIDTKYLLKEVKLVLSESRENNYGEY